MKKRELIEFLVSLACTIVTFVLTIIYQNNIIIAIVTAMLTIVALQNITNIFREKSNKDILVNEILQSNERELTLIREQSEKVQAKLNIASKYIHINELETIERDFCYKAKERATIYVISNNLTKDKLQFLDEMIANIKHGVSYVYVVNKRSLLSATSLKNTITAAIESEKDQIDMQERFKIIEVDPGFSFVTAKYTLIIYDNGFVDISSDGSAGYCCAQDDTSDGIYFFPISYDNLIIIRNDIVAMIGKIETASTVQE